ncbi:MAG: T9SS type A sorting domain-containing protein [Saprospiraceae bacterium]|nr:T9SS type A sorting domain-containing protein [Saprospiraceae bacterium]
MKSLFSFHFVVLLHFMTVHAQEEAVLYTYGGGQDEIGYDIVTGADGNLILLTSDRTISQGSEDICLLQLNESNKLQDRRCFGSDKQDYPYGLIRTRDGGLLVSGTRWKGRRDAYLLKLDREWEMEWEAFYDGGSRHHDEGFNAIETRDGGYLLSGMTRSSGGVVTRGSTLLLKVTADGQQEWAIYEGTTTKNFLFDVLQDEAGDFVSVGVVSGHHRYSEFEFYNPSASGLIIKHDESGQELWRRQLGGMQNDWMTDVALAPHGGYYVMGSTQSMGAGSFDMYLAKISNDGQLEWERTFGEVLFDYGRQVTILDNGDLLLLGTSCRDPQNFETDIVLVRTNDGGHVLWEETYGADGSEVAHALLIKDGTAFVVGEQRAVGQGDRNALVLKIPLGVTVDVNEADLMPRLAHSFPNPANQVVHFDVRETSSCSGLELVIYSPLGVPVATYDLSPGVGFDLNIADWSSGHYFYTITSTCGRTQSSKLIVF